MAKGDYFFPLYYQRLLTSTIGWKDDEFGAYVKLLIYQYDNGFIPKDIEAIARISATAKKSWALIGKKFIEKDGYLINPVMDEIRSKRKKKGETNRTNGEKGGRPKNPNDNPNETQKEPTGLFIETQTETNTNMVNGLMDKGYFEKGGMGEKEPSGIVPEMCLEFSQQNPGYPLDNMVDYPAARMIAQKVLKWQGLKGDITQPENHIAIRIRWGELVPFIRADPHFSGYSLTQINKYFQSIAQSFSNGGIKKPAASGGKSEGANQLVDSLRADLIAATGGKANP